MTDTVEPEIIWVPAWALWNQRNAKVMQGTAPTPENIALKARKWLDEWRNANATEPHRTTESKQTWTAPVVGGYKINVDGALINASGQAGAGAIIRNAQGEFMAAMCYHQDNVATSEHIEAVAVLQALDVALGIGLDNIVLEGDALGVIQAINNDEEDLSAIGNIILAIKMKAQCFHSIVFQHVRREANAAAHRLAKKTLILDDYTVWMEEPPPFLCDVLFQDNLSLSQ